MASKDFFEAVALGTPFYFAAATYVFFNWLDRNASAQATRALSRWLKSQPYQRIDVHAAFIGAFDRIYTSPLLHPRELLRSAIFSSAAFITSMIYDIFSHLFDFLSMLVSWWPYLVAVILSDYIALFVVRGYLLSASARPLASLYLGFLYGVLVASFAYKLGQHS